jgi:hypothetical protein
MSVQASLAWLRRNLPLPRRARSWAEGGGVVLLLAGAGSLWWYGGRLTAVSRAALAALLLATLIVLLGRGWLRLFGPVLFYDLVRTRRAGGAPRAGALGRDARPQPAPPASPP